MNNNKFVSLYPSNIVNLVNQLNSSLKDKMIIIGGECSAVFDGRIKSTLKKGERILIIKKDLSIVMHGPKGVKPLNWQKAKAGPIEFSNDEGKLMMYTKRKKTEEEMIVTFTHLDFVFAWIAADDTTMEVYGDETDLVAYLVEHPDIIEKEMQIITTEYETDVGYIDIKALDKEKRETIIEVKKRAANPSDAFQLKRYKQYFNEKERKEVRTILIAPSFPDKVKKYLTENKMEWKVIHWKEIFPSINRAKNAKLENFFG